MHFLRSITAMINVNRQEVTREPRTEDSQLGRKPDSREVKNNMNRDFKPGKIITE